MYLKDPTDFKGANLKFKARTNCLGLESRRQAWYSDGTGNCKLCTSNTVEDVKHFLLECPCLEDVRLNVFTNVKMALLQNNLQHYWEIFVNGSTELQILFFLDDLFSENTTLGSIFDKFCKIYLKEAWVKRNDILNYSA